MHDLDKTIRERRSVRGFVPEQVASAADRNERHVRRDV